MSRAAESRFERLRSLSVALLFATVLASGCIDTEQEQKAPLPIPMKALYAAPADKVLTSTLLDFDGPYDSTFVAAPRVLLVDDPVHAVNRTLAVRGRGVLNLASLVRGRDFGGAWDLISVKVWSDAATNCTLSLDGASGMTASMHQVLTPHVWNTLWLEIPKLPATRRVIASTLTTAPDADDRLQLVVSGDADARLQIDDVALAQSHVVICDTHVPKTGEHWTITRVGLRWQAAIDGKSFYELPAAPFVTGGYRAIESGPTRAVFTNDSGSTISLDRTGRLIENGVAKLDPGVLRVGKAIAENASPAAIEIVGEEGRVDRTLPGDHNNDGYDETRGCYTVHAIGGRATVRFTPQHATVKWPALEILDLPPGPVSVWVAGETVPWVVRADDGRAIAELPLELDSPVEVQVRVK